MTVLQTAMEIYFKVKAHSAISSCQRDKGLWGAGESFHSPPEVLHFYGESGKTCTRLALQRYTGLQKFGLVVLIYKSKSVLTYCIPTAVELPNY